ncbi:terminase family protein [Chelativorans sp. Marseille-P2723]|uniref:DNA-packaging protein n=1 Tax=Chelativorans sp. Marseille-P2723 TaxID=2709133 RepID=UPI001FED2B3B|nr:terminase family protein [Chelativorans sp. Marseille-P2723]
MHGRLPQYPVGARLKDTWLVLGGRGSGKTRLGAEWVNALVRGLSPFAGRKYGRIALVGETLGDVREVMIEGPSGILSVSRTNRPRYEPSRRRLVWDDGAVAMVFSSEDPDSLRGPQFEAAWCDEVAKWKNAEAVFDMLQFGLRLGERPVQLLTTTPKPVPLIRKLVVADGITVTRMRTEENGAHLAPAFLRTVERNYAGTRLGRQELDGELIDDRDDALWTRASLEATVGQVLPDELRRIVVAVDPPATSRRTSDACGIVVAGLAEDGTGWVLHDGTLSGAKPERWAASVTALFRRFEADTIVAEVNQGGEMVASVIATVDPTAPVKPVRASRGKWVRAEPVAALYAQGRVRHAARFPELEDEMCDFGTDGLSGGRSPDRVDALVWALTELMLGSAGEPRIRDFS